MKHYKIKLEDYNHSEDFVVLASSDEKVEWFTVELSQRGKISKTIGYRKDSRTFIHLSGLGLFFYNALVHGDTKSPRSYGYYELYNFKPQPWNYKGEL